VATSYGVLVCYDAKTGEKYWEKEFSNGFYSSPMIAEGKLYVIDVHGVTHILKADKTGTVLAEPELGEPVYTLPVFEDGVLYLRGLKNLYCIDK
jgi:outer membrane protein assembly factor BamB